MKLGLIGCGVIGQRRIQNLPEGSELVAAFDPVLERAQSCAKSWPNALATASEAEFYAHLEIEAVIIAGVNSILVGHAEKCLKKNWPVLVEKPAARSYGELLSLKNSLSANDLNKKVKIGFNHRFHPAYFDLLNELENHAEDPIMYIQARYGNGARVGFDQEWRAQVDISGGGELLDQGVHILDLATRILPGLDVKTSWVRTQYWNMPVDDNAWAVLSTPQGQTFSMHVSSSEWKNEFRFEVYTRKRKYLWSGLGRSYGPEKLIIYTMTPEMGPPQVEERSYPGEDQSWLLENTNFIQAVTPPASHSAATSLNGGYEDALKVLKLVEKIYQVSEKTNGGEFSHPKWWSK